MKTMKIKNIISYVLLIQILMSVMLPVAVNAVNIEFPVKKTIEQTQEKQTVYWEDEENSKTIKEVDWKNLSDEELAKSIHASSEQELSSFLKNLTKDETREILSKETSLANPYIIGTQTGEIYIDENGEDWPEVKFETSEHRYYDYLIGLEETKEQENNSQDVELLSWEDNTTTYQGTSTGYFYLRIQKDGVIGTSMKVAVTEEVTSDNKTLSPSQYKITIDKNNDGWVTTALKIEKQNGQWAGMVLEGRYTKPAHYYTTWEVENYEERRPFGRFRTYNGDGVESLDHGHAATTDSVRIECNGMQSGFVSGYRHNHAVGTIQMVKFNESLLINPNGGTHGGKTSTYTLATKQCTLTTTVANPTRTGYRFTGWSISHGTGASGTLSGTTYTHCISDAGWDQDMERVGGPNGVYTQKTRTTTLTANWVLDTMDIQGSISWMDNNNKYASRPANATINLYRDNQAINSTKQLSTYIFRSLPIYNTSTGSRYKYSISQNQIPGYETTYSGYNVVNKLILPVYISNIIYTPIDTYENRYLKNGKIEVKGEITADTSNKDKVGLHGGQAIFQVDNDIIIDPSTIEVKFYEASTASTINITNYQVSGNTITATYGKDINGITQKGDKITFKVQGMANKIGQYESIVKATGKLKDYRGENTNINLGEITKKIGNVTAEYQMPKAKIQITKKDSITEQNLQDATFTLYEWDGTQYVEKEIITDTDGDGIYTSKEYEWNNITKGKYKVIETGIPIYHKNLDFSMEYTINQLKTNNYTITPEYNNGAYKIAYALRTPDDFDMLTGVVENEPIKVKAKIEKIDEETKQQITKDTTFTIYEWDNLTNEYKEYISHTTNNKVEMKRQSDGTYQTSEWLYYTPSNEGKYRIIETTAPSGYYGDFIDKTQNNQKNTYDINIVEIVETGIYKGQTVSNESTLIIQNQGIQGNEQHFTNKRTKAAAYLELIDSQTKTNLTQGDATFEGATYGIYAKENIYHADGVTTNYEEEEALIYKSGELVQTLQTDENGRLVFDDLECGKYYIKQLKEPVGYLPNQTEYELDLTYQGEDIEKVGKSITTELVVKKQAFQMYKLQNSEDTEYNPLDGAGFSIYLISKLNIVTQEKVTKNKNGTYTLNDEQAKEDKNLTSKANQDGTYDIRDLVDYYYKTKNDVAARTYSPYNMQEEELVKNYNNTPDGEYIQEQTTNTEGYLKSPELAYGDYIILETSVPTNYETAKPFIVNIKEDSRNVQNLRFIIDKNFKARVRVNKIDETTGKLILNNTAKYVIRQKDTNKLITYKTWDSQNKYVEYGTMENPFTISDEGYLITPMEIEAGNYELIELEAPDGYVLNGYEGYSQNFETINAPKSITQINITTNTAQYVDGYLDSIVITIKQENQPQVGALKISTNGEKLSNTNKTEEENYQFIYEEAGIQGATYEIKAKETIYTLDGHKIVLYNKDEVVQTITTNEQGLAYADNLPIGKYYILQTKAGDGYTLNLEQQEFEVTYGTNNEKRTKQDKNWKQEAQKTSVTKQEKTYTNQRQKLNIEIVKKDMETNQTIEGAEFAIYNKNPIVNMINKEELLQKDTKIQTATTNQEGKLQFQNELPLGEYYIKEEKAAKGYIRNTQIVEVDGRYAQDQREKIDIQTEYMNQKTDIRIYKFDENNENLEGAILQIIEKDSNNIVEQWETTKEAHTIKGLEIGKNYILKEVKPAIGYATADDMEFSIQENEKLQVNGEELQENAIIMKDPIIKVEIHLKNKEGEYIQGAKLQIVNKETGEVIEEWTTGTESHKIEKLPIGEYIIKQVYTPTQEGYATFKDKEITVVDTKEPQIKEITQSETSLEISIKNKEGEYIQGAKIQLINKETGEIVEEWTTDDKPHIIEKLPVGEYQIKEIEAPSDEGYTLFEPKDIQVIDTEELQKEEQIQPEIKVEIHIKDKEENYVEDVVVQIKDKETGEVIEEWTTDDKPHIIEKLPPKDYIIHIVEVPEDKGFVLIPDKEITVENTSEVQKEEITQDVTKLSISIEDIDTQEAVIGATLQIVDKVGNILAEWISDGKEHIVEKIPVGKHKVVQKEAPTLRGYVKASPLEIEVINTQETQKVVVKEPFTKIETQLIDKISKEVIKGATLVIKDEKEKELLKWTSTEEMYHIERLPVGKYTVESINEVYGYKKVKIEIQIEETQQIQTYLLEAQRDVFDLEVTKRVDKVIRNGKNEQKNTMAKIGRVTKVDIKEKKAKTENIKIVYKIRVTNIGKITGTIGKIIENIPKGFEYKQEDNKSYWKQENNKIVSTGLADKQIKAGEYAELEIVLRWKNGLENFGTKTNIVTLEDVKSDLDFIEDDKSNNEAKAEVIMGVSTGEMAMLKICWILMAMLLIIEALAVKQLRKKSYKKVIYKGK